MPHPSQYFEFPKTSIEEMMREWMARQTEANERMNNQGNVKFIEEDEITPIPTIPNPKPINSNSPTVSLFLKDYTVNITYANTKTFADDVSINNVGDKELKSYDGVGTGRITKKEKNENGVSKEPNKNGS
ncbi:hypothetical protein Tco_0020155 [Tanacetum coccineum]